MIRFSSAGEMPTPLSVTRTATRLVSGSSISSTRIFGSPWEYFTALSIRFQTAAFAQDNRPARLRDVLECVGAEVEAHARKFHALFRDPAKIEPDLCAAAQD